MRKFANSLINSFICIINNQKIKIMSEVEEKVKAIIVDKLG